METLDSPIPLTPHDKQICAWATLIAVLFLLPQIAFIIQHSRLLCSKERCSFNFTMVLLGICGIVQLLIHLLSVVITLMGQDQDWIEIFSSIMLSTWFATLLFVPLLILQKILNTFTKQSNRADIMLVFTVLSVLIVILSIFLFLYFMATKSTQFLSATFSWVLLEEPMIRNLYKNVSYVVIGCIFFGNLIILLHKMIAEQPQFERSQDHSQSSLFFLPASLFIGVLLIFSIFIRPIFQMASIGTFLSHFLFVFASAAFGINNLLRICFIEETVLPTKVSEFSSSTAGSPKVSLTKQQKSFLKSLKHKLITKL
ncbi:unnamed protein product, partial [Mesorhabditis belari]|uniref:Taste receptor type 2 n=1 Tax=Mesorhabditis belari TaxID=2138241 RepID=A0AAF3F0T4_9BILA